MHSRACKLSDSLCSVSLAAQLGSEGFSPALGPAEGLGPRGEMESERRSSF